MTRLTKSQPVALLGEAPPRVLVTPKGARANSWQEVADLSAALGIALDGWQELILEAAMGERSDKTWAAKRVGVSVPRQNGKSQLLVSRAIAGALLFGEKKIVVSAHQQDTARESFAKLMEIVEDDGNSALRGRVKSVMNALNRESVKFANGATIQFKARSGAAGKGFSSDCLLLDEAQILGSRAWTSINSTMSAMPNPQVWLLGTPPQEEDDCYTFEMVRRAAIDGASTAAAWCEWSADPAADGFDPASEYTRWSANPAWNTRINHEVVQGEFETYAPDKFAQDRLGVWRSESHAAVIPGGTWTALRAVDPPAQAETPTALAVDMSHDRVIAVAACWKREGVPHVELVTLEQSTDTLATVEWLERAGKRTPVVIDSASPAAAMIPALRQRGMKVVTTSATDMGKACGGLYDAATSGRMTHAGQKQLDDALAGAKKRDILGAGAWAWDRKDPTVNIAPLVAVTLALFGASITKAKTNRAVFA